MNSAPPVWDRQFRLLGRFFVSLALVLVVSGVALGFSGRLDSRISWAGTTGVAALIALSLLCRNASRYLRSARESMERLHATLKTEQRERNFQSAAIQRLTEEHERRLELLDLANVLIRDMEDRIIYWASGCTDLYGFEKKAALGQISHFLLQTHFPTWPGEIRTRLMDVGRWEGELIHRSASGAEIIVHSVWVLFRDPSGQPTAVLESNTDITATKRAQAELRDSERRFKALANNIPQLAWMASPSGDIFWYNQRWYDYTGTGLEEMKGWGWTKVHHPVHVDRVVRELRRCFESGAPWEDTFPLRSKSGEYRWFLSRAMPIRNKEGGIELWFGTNTDINDLRATRDALAAAKISSERAKEAAEQSRRSAEAANTAKDRFLAILSHELRTPLTPVLAALDLIEQEEGFPERFRADMAMIRRNVQLEARLIDDLLDVTRIVHGKLPLHKRPLDLRAIVTAALEVCRPDLNARGLHFGMIFGSDGNYLVEADFARLQQVFWNVLKNAIKFTPHGGCIGLRCHTADTHAVVEVIDSGPGFSSSDKARIFQPFEQGSQNVTRKFGGLGLGLAISKAILELHDGSIEADSDGHGHGATFIIRLPLAKSAEKPKDHTGQPAPGRARPDGKTRILLVEDHGDTATIMQRMLGKHGYRVDWVADIQSALRKVSETTYDGILSDLGLPDGSGLELVKKVHQHCPTLPAIALSGYGQQEDIEQSHRAGFVEHLVKPVDPNRLFDVLAASGL